MAAVLREPHVVAHALADVEHQAEVHRGRRLVGDRIARGEVAERLLAAVLVDSKSSAWRSVTSAPPLPVTVTPRFTRSTPPLNSGDLREDRAHGERKGERTIERSAAPIPATLHPRDAARLPRERIIVGW